jgi:hypothetical protein
MAALTKPLFPMAVTVDMVLAERVGRGIRGALVADVTPAE